MTTLSERPATDDAEDDRPPEPPATATDGADAERSGSLRTGIVQVALALTYLSSATNPWNGWRVGVGRPGDTFLVLALLAFFFADAGRTWPRLPGWVKQFGVVIAVITIAHEVLPTSAHYLSQRLVYSGTEFIRGNVEIQPNIVVGIKFLIPVLGLPLMFAFAYMHDRRALFRSAYAFAIGSAISALIGVTDLFHITHLSLQLTGIPSINNRSPGLTRHPNFLAMTCVLSLPVLLWQLQSHSLRRRVWTGVLILPILLGLYASGSRAGAAVGAGAILLSFVLLPAYRRLLPTVALITVGLGAVAFVVVPGLGHSVLQAVRLGGNTGSADGSDYARSIVSHQGVSDFLHSPIDGIGLQVAEEAHNVYLQALASGGVILLVSYVAFVLSGLIKSLGQMRFDPLAYPFFVSAFAGALFLIVQAALTDRVAYVWLALISALPLGEAADPRYTFVRDGETGVGARIPDDDIAVDVHPFGTA